MDLQTGGPRAGTSHSMWRHLRGRCRRIKLEDPSPLMTSALSFLFSAQIFRLPNKPGVQPPPVESIIMLLIAERAWQRFGRNCMLIELFFYLAYLSILSFVAMDRISDEPVLVLNPCAFPQPHPTASRRHARSKAVPPPPSLAAPFLSVL